MKIMDREDDVATTSTTLTDPAQGREYEHQPQPPPPPSPQHHEQQHDQQLQPHHQHQQHQEHQQEHQQQRPQEQSSPYQQEPDTTTGLVSETQDALHSIQLHKPGNVQATKLNVTVDCSTTQYPIVARAATNAGFRVITDVHTSSKQSSRGNQITIIWSDDCIKPDEIKHMKRTGVRWNHFPGCESICTKCGLQQTLARLSELHPKHFKFTPKSWSLPVQWIKLDHHMKTKGIKAGTTLIVKPNTLSRGRGIYLTQKVPERGPENVVVQEYIARPLTIGGYKFDLRMYVLVTDMRCCDGGVPRVFLHHEGLARFCTTLYTAPARDNLDDNTQHLSNYSVNKWSTEYQQSAHVKKELEEIKRVSDEKGLLAIDGEYVFGGGVGGGVGCGLTEDAVVDRCRRSQQGSKWTLTAFAEWAKQQGHDVGLIWRRCCDLVAKTIVAAAVTRMRDQYVNNFGDAETDDGLGCFELMGIDVMLDENLRPYLLEVNMAPSSATGSGLDLIVKEDVHSEALRIASLSPCPTTTWQLSNENVLDAKRRWREHHEDDVCRGYQRILPVRDLTTKKAETYAMLAAYRPYKSKGKPPASKPWLKNKTPE